MDFILDAQIFYYRIGEFLCSFTYENGRNDVLIRFSQPFSTKIVQTSIHENDCPNEQAQKDYLKNKFDFLLESYKKLL